MTTLVQTEWQDNTGMGTGAGLRPAIALGQPNNVSQRFPLPLTLGHCRAGNPLHARPAFLNTLAHQSDRQIARRANHLKSLRCVRGFDALERRTEGFAGVRTIFGEKENVFGG